MKRIKIGLYGTNGHQPIPAHHPDAEFVTGSLDELLADDSIEVVSLCSPLRKDQAADAIRCLQAGKHVFAEKPAALTEVDLDAIIATARQTGRRFHEMAGTLVESPYREMRRLIQAGAIGNVVQILAQKSYPWRDSRPADDAVDGGLTLQVGVYIGRFVEHVAGQKIASLEIAESECRRAVAMLIRLQNGGVASAVCNYLNPFDTALWGYEILRVFGTKGLIESNSDGHRARLILNGQPPAEIELSPPPARYFDLFLRSLRGGDPMPLSLEDELNPTRWVIRARHRDVSGRRAGSPVSGSSR